MQTDDKQVIQGENDVSMIVDRCNGKMGLTLLCGGSVDASSVVVPEAETGRLRAAILRASYNAPPPEALSTLVDVMEDRERIASAHGKASQEWNEASRALARATAELDAKVRRLEKLRVSPWERLSSIVNNAERFGVDTHITTNGMRLWWDGIAGLAAENSHAYEIEQLPEDIETARALVRDAIITFEAICKKTDALEAELQQANDAEREAGTGTREPGNEGSRRDPQEKPARDREHAGRDQLLATLQCTAEIVVIDRRAFVRYVDVNGCREHGPMDKAETRRLMVAWGYLPVTAADATAHVD